MSDILNKELADTLCTVITVGFMIQDGKNTRWVYEAPPPKNGIAYTEEEKEELNPYKTLRDKLKNYRIQPPEFTPQDSKQSVPMIISKTPKSALTSNELWAQDLHPLVTELEKAANPVDQKTPLMGAYLGGQSSVSKTTLVGVSDVYPYEPRYRTLDLQERETVYASYQASKKVRNEVAKLLKNRNFSKNVTLEDGCAEQNNLEMQKGNLYASVHGMTKAIIHFAANCDSNDFVFEIALSDSTSKVASCVPCAIFMNAVHKPATATHLGRGDNWNFPQFAKPSDAILKTAWVTKLSEYFNCGCSTLQENEKVKRLFQNVEKNGLCLPELFLEALTFEGKFSDRMMNVL